MTHQTNRFKRGSGCFTCKVCGKRTRDTGDNGDLELCPKCFEEAGLENEHSDGHHDEHPSKYCPICIKEAAAPRGTEAPEHGASEANRTRCEPTGGRLTLKGINQALATKGYTAELFRGNGYFYFSGGEAGRFTEQGVYCQHLTSLTLEQWLRIFEEKYQEAHQFDPLLPVTGNCGECNAIALLEYGLCENCSPPKSKATATNMNKLEGISWTQGQQGGIGYPPELVHYRNKWHWVEDSRNHGGSICFACSEYRNIPYGFTPQGFGQQPKSYGSTCYRSLVPQCKKRPRKLNGIQYMPWEEFRGIIRELYGEPEVIKQ